jgi:hypothetical protein
MRIVFSLPSPPRRPVVNIVHSSVDARRAVQAERKVLVEDLGGYKIALSGQTWGETLIDWTNKFRPRIPSEFTDS